MKDKKINIKKLAIIIAGIVEITSNIVGIITAYNWSKRIGITIICVSLLIILIGIIIFIYNFFQSKKAIALYLRESTKEQQEIISDFHHIVHDIRDTSFDIRNKESYSVEQLDDLFKRMEINLCTNIEKMLGKIFDRKTSVCLKLLSAGDIVNDDYNKWKLYTFARGYNSSDNGSQSGRGKNDDKPILIAENSDFQIIVDGLTNFFICQDMSDIRNEFFNSYQIPYKNSRDNNKEKFSDYYNSTIVVPIRIEKNHFVADSGNCDNFHLLGFICVDTYEPFSTEEEGAIFNIGVEYVKALADSLYRQILEYFIKRLKLKNKILSHKGQEVRDV